MPRKKTEEPMITEESVLSKKTAPSSILTLDADAEIET